MKMRTVVSLAALLVMVLVAVGCLSYKSSAPAGTLMHRELIGEQTVFHPTSDGQYQKESTNSAQLDNIGDMQALSRKLADAEVDPLVLIGAAEGTPDGLANLLAELEAKDPALAKEFKSMLAQKAVGSGLVTINGNTADVARSISADVAAQVTSALRAAVAGAMKESTNAQDQPNVSGGSLNPPITVTPVP